MLVLATRLVQLLVTAVFLASVESDLVEVVVEARDALVRHF